jgi:hypothetical protein
MGNGFDMILIYIKNYKLHLNYYFLSLRAKNGEVLAATGRGTLTTASSHRE